MNADKPHYTDAEKIKRLTAWREADKKELAAQADTIAQLREALEQAEKVVEWAHRYIHADTNEKDTEAFYGMRKAVVLYKKNAALKGGE